jgi:hypothetical protein
MASTVPPWSGRAKSLTMRRRPSPGGARPPTQVRGRAIWAVPSEHGIKIAPSIYAQAKTPITLAELAEAYLVIALVDLHSADWAS